MQTAPTTRTDLQTAETILRQLGGRRFLAMTGAKNLVGGDNLLQFRIPRAQDGINSVVVTLDWSDTYTVSFYKIRGVDVVKISEQSDVYAEDLQAVFHRHTGLYTSL